MKTLTAAIVMSVLGCTVVGASEFDVPLHALAEAELAAIVAQPDLLAAVAAQNAQNADIAQARIDELDKTWRAEAASGGTLVDRVLSNETSVMLRKLQEESGGLYSEIFVMDNVGLNDGQSSVTSDCWQGDEAKMASAFQPESNTFRRCGTG